MERAASADRAAAGGDAGRESKSGHIKARGRAESLTSDFKWGNSIWFLSDEQKLFRKMNLICDESPHFC